MVRARLIALVLPSILFVPSLADAQRGGFTLREGDTICLLGNALAERMQHHGWLETALQLRFPELDLSVRNLGFSADELTVQQRTAGFGTWDDYLTRCGADVIFAFFGFNESFAGEDGLLQFEVDLDAFLKHTRAQRYNGEGAPRIVLFSPIAMEDHGVAHLPDGAARNDALLRVMRVMSTVARRNGAPFVNLFHPMKRRYAEAGEPLTINGLHLTERGNAVLAEVVEADLFGDVRPRDAAREAAVRDAVLDKNLLWFNRYRATDGYNVYGGRSSLKYTDDLSNFTVLQREMEVLDAMCEARDDHIARLARGERSKVDESRVPPLIPVKTNKPGSLPDGSHEMASGEDAIASMTVAAGMKVNLFADEARFPALANPVQMAWDTKGRLWVAAWPTYPHWEPGQPMNDKLLILEDTDGDGRADECKVFADDLHNPTGFEFWNGGVFVANCPDLLFLRDTDGDDKADFRERVLHGLSSADTHHAANSLVLDPGGALHFQEGTFHMSQIETIHGPQRSQNAAAWRFEPRTWRVERNVAYNFANPHGHVFDRWGQEFLTDGTGNVNYYVLPFSGRVVHPDKHRGYFPFFKQESRPCAGTEILSSAHFPDENQGNYLVANVIGFRGIFQYEVHDDGSGFRGAKVESIVFSSDETFRPADIEMGPDGAIYFLDWSNPIIGHMQHHLRDPSRDDKHGRVYRVTYEGRPLSQPARIAGRPIDELLELLQHRDDRVRYRTRIEFSGRDSGEVIAAARRWLARLDRNDPDFEHHRLEGLWLHQQHARTDQELLSEVLRSSDHRARAAATRVVRGMRHFLPDPLALLAPMASDEHPRVRLEAVVAASYFDSARAAEIALDALRRPTDKFLDYALTETMRTLEPFWKGALRAGQPFAADNPDAVRYLLDSVTEAELVNMPRVPAVLDALLTRHGVDVANRKQALVELAQGRGTTALEELLDAIERVDKGGGGHARHILHELGMLLQDELDARGASARDRLVELATGGRELETRQAALAGVALVDGTFDRAWDLASGTREGMKALLLAIPIAGDESLRASLYERVRPLMFHLGERHRTPGQSNTGRVAGIEVQYFPTRITSAKRAVFDELSPAQTLIVQEFSHELAGIRPPDAYALRFRTHLAIAEEGHYTFFTNSDDGSRLFVDGSEVVQNDGAHAMRERKGDVHLVPGSHELEVTWFDQGGGDGLFVSWKGPGFDKQAIPASLLSMSGADAVRDAAIRAMASIPGHDEERFSDAGRLIGEGTHLEAAIHLLEQTPRDRWPASRLGEVVAGIAAHVERQPAEMRTTPRILAALEIGRQLASAMPDAEAEAARRSLAGLGGSTILIRTVPHEMLYDRKEFGVVAGKPVAIVFQNNDVMPHNLVVTTPGTMETVGKAAEALGPDAQDRAFIPDSDDVLWHTGLLNPGESTSLRFVAPAEPGGYPYVCTFPGHWRVMNGVMRVYATEAELAQARASAPAGVVEMPVGSAPARRFVKMWKVEDLVPRLRAGWKSGRDLERGRVMFDDAGCARCHTFGDEGTRTGPPLAGIGEKYAPVDLLKEIISPSTTILEGYTMHSVNLKDGSSVLGRILEEDAARLQVIPYMMDEQDIRVIPKRDVRSRTPQTLSPMPEGLLVTLTQEEILDLLWYLRSPGS